MTTQELKEILKKKKNHLCRIIEDVGSADKHHTKFYE